MLRELSVQNLTLFEDARIELQPGFCAWTGETGAGKTLLLEALGLLLGERSSTDLIRTPAEELRVTGRFELPRPELRQAAQAILGIELEEDQIILSRRLTHGGRTYAYVNELPVAIATLRRLGEILVDIHSQRESQSLLQPAYQLRLLDAFGDLDRYRRNYQELAETVRELRRKLAGLDADRLQRQKELALLQFERAELDNADLRGGELAELTQERERLAHARGLQTFAMTGCEQLYDAEGSIAERLGKVQHEAETWGALDPALAEVARRLGGLRAETEDLAEALRGLARRFEANPERQEQVEERQRLLRRLETKYGRSVEDLVAYRATLDEQETRLQQQEDDRSTLQSSLEGSFQELRQAGKELSRQRQKIAKRLVTATQHELAALGMAEARLDAALEGISLGDDPMQADVPTAGFEQLELMLAANRGEPSRPLRKVASGGELSRTMLALKTVLAAHDQVSTLIFDEIDANVGGRLGDVLGEKLAALGQTHQVICVTHLPQVASYARHQWTIRKESRGQRTVTSIQLLDEKDRLDELASMLRGKSQGETTRKEAAAMLAAAKRRWS
jgi:DNA repair protein RecN (Recombination protein N)